jgi:hypothetical protein
MIMIGCYRVIRRLLYNRIAAQSFTGNSWREATLITLLLLNHDCTLDAWIGVIVVSVRAAHYECIGP